MNECHSRLVECAPEQPARKRGRRKQERTRLVYRLVHVEHEGDEGLARCRNISDGGMKLDLSMRVAIGDRLRVAFSLAHVFTGTVVWTRQGECGVSLDRCIDSDEMLRQSAAQTRALGSSGLRLNRDLPATLRCDGRTRRIRVNELTQHGMRLIHDGDIYASARLTVTLGADKERQGVVRWSDGEVADVMLLEPFSVGELGSLSALS